MIKRLLFAACLLGALTIVPSVVDGVLVAPHAVFIEHRSRTGQLTLINTSEQPEEVSIDLQFGYPATDSAGNVFIRFIDAPDADMPSAADWVRVFPRRLRLFPGQRQIARLLATPPANLPDGEYWSRIIVTSRAEPSPVDEGEGVTVGINIEFRTVLALSYRKGAVRTEVDVTDLRFETTEDSLVTWVGLQRGGNAAYLGSLTVSVRDTVGTVLRSWPTTVAVYYDLLRRFAFPLDDLPAGTYTAHLELNTDRADLAPEQVLPARPVVRSAGITIP